jgi:hypothetical protein
LPEKCQDEERESAEWKAGRPSYHIPAKWITVTLPQKVLYFEFDKKRNLQSRNVAPRDALDRDTIPLPTQITQSSIPEPITIPSAPAQIQIVPPRAPIIIIAGFTNIDIDINPLDFI